jgi:hypothetical protein
MIEKIELPDQVLYLKDGLNHRPNGPASYYDEMNWFWYLYGKPHRYYGPAWRAFKQEWRIHGAHPR